MRSMGLSRMIEKVLLGKTAFGGEVFYLRSDRVYDIPAVRIFASTQRRIRELVSEPVGTIEEFIDYLNAHPETSKPYLRKILSYHHGDIGELDFHGIYLKSVSRLFTFLGWMPIGANRGIKAVGTELSLRYCEARGSIDLPDGRLKSLSEESIALYQRLKEKKVPREDARYVLPLTTRTEEIDQIPLGRDLAKWASYMKSQPFDEAKGVGEILSKWNEEENGFTLPTEEVPEVGMPLKAEDEDEQRRVLRAFLSDKPGDVYYDPYTQSLVWLSKRSIASFHQDVRNRQVYFWWPSWESVINDTDFYLPHSFPQESEKEARSHFLDLLEASRKYWRGGNFQSAVYALPLGKKMEVYCAIYGNSNIYETVRLRACMRAQHEIRNQYRLILKKIGGRFPRKLGARCEVEGVCFEPKKERCPLYRRYILGVH